MELFGSRSEAKLPIASPTCGRDLDREGKTMMRLGAKREEQIRGVVELTVKSLSAEVSCWRVILCGGPYL